MLKIKFWGVRGSIPSPLTPKQISEKVKKGIQLSQQGLPIPFEIESTYGGNTTCVEVNCINENNKHLFILDMGTGVRELGNTQMSEIIKNKRLSGTILQSHVHWDHIQGIPFWKPLYLPKRKFDCEFDFYGGKQWDSQLDLVYRGQMSPPVFPINLQELELTSMNMYFHNIYDGWIKEFFSYDKKINVLARKLFHPQETFGYRIEYEGKSMAFTTDHEPYSDYQFGISLPLAELVKDVDVWITDCQYTLHQYIGKNGPARHNWGHSYPEYIAHVAKETQPKSIITTHHDPEANDFDIKNIANLVQDLSKIETKPAYEGLEIEL